MASVRIRRLIDAVPLLVAIIIAITAPLAFLLDAVREESGLLQFKANLGATRVARYIYTHPTMWQYHGLRIAETIQLPEPYAVQQSVYDLGGQIVAEDGLPVAGPALHAEAPVIVSDTTVGTFRVATSVLPLLQTLAGVTAGSWVLAALCFVAVRRLPIRALNRALDQLARQKGLFEAALDNMSQGLCMLDDSLNVVVVNRRLLEMFGLHDTGPLIGRPADEAVRILACTGRMSEKLCRGIVLPPAAQDGSAPAGTMRAGDTQVESIEQLPDGRCLSIERHCMDRGGWLTTVTDITDRLRAERAELGAEQLQERERHALEVGQAKSMFLATMSHEIRTPMNGVLGLASSLLHGELGGEQRQVIETIRDSGDRLMHILNDILDFSKLEVNRLVFEPLPFAPGRLAPDVEAVLGLRGRAKGLRIMVTEAGDLPEAVVGDAGRLRQVLMNLVANAIKFTPHGEVSVETRCLARTADAATIEWQVRDTGIGIEPDKLGRLFDEFTQADGSINRRFGGSGLGLAISKRLVERMGGTLSVASVPGGGSTFRFRLTLPRGQLAATGKQDPVSALKSWLAGRDDRPRILVAEDNPTNQFVLNRMLTSLGLCFDMTGNGVEAAAAAMRVHYDAICMDCQMPEMDGPDATRLIRARGGWLAAVPILALTGNAFDDSRQSCTDAGMNDFLTKPVSMEALAAALLRALAPDGDALPRLRPLPAEDAPLPVTVAA